MAVERHTLESSLELSQFWSIDFVSDALANGRRIRVQTIVDDFSKEAIDQVAAFGISGQYVTRVLDRAARSRGYPKEIRTDQGPEFAGKALDQWDYKHGMSSRLAEVRKILKGLQGQSS